MRCHKQFISIIALLVLSFFILGQSGPCTPPPPTPTPTPSPNDVVIQTGVMDQMIAMADGTQLATDVYSATGNGPWPVVLSRTPYDRKEAFNADRGSTFGGAGVVYIVQDVRGQFGSESTADFFGSEEADGPAVINLIAAQSWCNGRIALLGNSAPGIAGYLALPGAPSSVSCAWIEVATGNLYATVYQGGVFRQALVEGWLDSTSQNHMLPSIVANALDSSWWDSRRVIDQAGQITIPTVHLTGWYDIFAKDQIDMFQAIQSSGTGQQYLIVGPWSHNTLGTATTGQLSFPANAQLDINSFMEEWLAHFLLDDPGDVANWPVVRYYVMGDVDNAGASGNEWRTATTWPPFTATDRTFYLRTGGALNETAPATGEGADQFTYDPANPAPTVGGNNMIIDDGPFDQANVESRDDVITYTTDVLTAPLEVTGTIQAAIWIQTDVTDTDISVKVTDVYPDGRSMLITEGVLRTRFRNGSYSSEQLLTPNTPTQIDLSLWPTSIVFNTGHRIRVAVTSSNSTRFDPNPNTGDAFRANTNTQVATTQILHDANHSSLIILPTNL